MRRFLLLALAASGCATRPTAKDDVWKLTPLHTGICRIGADHALGDAYDADERLPFVIYSFLAENARGDVVLIDLGPKSLEYTNGMFRRFGFFRERDGERERPDDVVQPHGNVFDHLSRRGIPPERVGHVVFTHFHADHHGMHDATDGGAAEDFPNARMCVSKRGWAWNVERRKNGRWASYLDHAFGDFLLRMDREKRLDRIDEGEVLPGLEVRYLGGHSRCSRGVLVKTASGWAAITSDDVYRYDLLEDGVMARLHVTPQALVRATDRLAGFARDSRYQAVLLPLHEPAIWKAYRENGDQWLDALRPSSDRAVEGYLSKREGLRVLKRSSSSGGK